MSSRVLETPQDTVRPQNPVGLHFSKQEKRPRPIRKEEMDERTRRQITELICKEINRNRAKAAKRLRAQVDKAKQDDPLLYRWLSTVPPNAREGLECVAPEHTQCKTSLARVAQDMAEAGTHYGYYGAPAVPYGSIRKSYPYVCEVDDRLRERYTNDKRKGDESDHCVGVWMVDAHPTTYISDGEVTTEDATGDARFQTSQSKIRPPRIDPDRKKQFGPWIVNPYDRHDDELRNTMDYVRPQDSGPRGTFGQYCAENDRLCGATEWYRQMSKVEKLEFIESDMRMRNDVRLWNGSDREPRRRSSLSESIYALLSDGAATESGVDSDLD
ncbi:hypothetical protein DFP72DRAFT_532109 [Ephemerocybe angulata]|uniref:Uncharacterized protein n=1 Tax=Ephemerocybe angulata TaxID=980116 RepID=A0A8H6M1I2_9AGAR|nr:hypothetical protein DFP72DRAFT_532109 [Tulosesus angulatus]